METNNLKSSQLEAVCRLKLRNQAGVVTMLKGYVKVSDSSSEYYKCGATDNFPVGKERTLNLNDHEGDMNNPAHTRSNGYIFKGDKVTAYAAGSASKDAFGSVWLDYDPDANRTAVFTLSGAMWDLKVSFDGIEE